MNNKIDAVALIGSGETSLAGGRVQEMSDKRELG